ALVAGREESPKDDEKNHFIASCRARWRGGLGRWLATAIVIGQDLAPKYPALLGTGGNDGRLDFTNNFMQRLVELLADDGVATAEARHLAKCALFGGPSCGLIAGKAIGQFLPGGAGGANATTGFDADSILNPWDYILMLEGAVQWTATVARRLGTGGVSLITAPFALRSQGVGHGTAASSEDAPRGEQWMPLWSRPAGIAEVASLLAEGRLTTGSGPATRPIDAARALARLGTSRGIDTFQRFGYLERNGQANLAIPLGRWQVIARPDIDLVDHAADWVDRLDRACRGEGIPATWITAAHRCEEAMLACCRGSEPRHRVVLLVALGEAEAALARTPAKARDAGLRPLSHLPASWLTALPNEPWSRLAVAIAAQQSDELPLRSHWHTADGAEFAKAAGVEVVVTGHAFVLDGVAILRRRCRHAGAFSLQSGHPHAAGLSDLAALVRGEVDTAQMWSVIRPLLALDWADSAPLSTPTALSDDLGDLAVAGVLRLTHTATQLSGAQRVLSVDPGILARLLAGDISGAVTRAARRLSGIGQHPHVVSAVGDRNAAQRLAATLLVPLHPAGLATLAKRLTRPHSAPAINF
ncbi:MAG: type I-U CRISPR-associated protein Csx17, partial [Planctomycetes bacterium]|nr:type I-U CRISPR-associated protein Csx17 [Planctomycetota bacterium]